MSSRGSAACFQWAAVNIWTLSLLNALSELYSPPLAEHSVIYYCRLHWLIHALVLWENLAVLTWQSISTPTLWWHHTLMRKTAVSMAKWERCHYWAGVVQMDCSLPQPHPLVGFSYRSEFNFCRDAGNKWLLKKKKKKNQGWRKGDRVLYESQGGFVLCYFHIFHPLPSSED